MYASGLSIESDVRSLLRHIRSEQSRIAALESDDAAARKRVAELLAENARLREGLDFYAKIEHYLDFDNGWPGCAIYEDRGRLARALLAGSPTP